MKKALLCVALLLAGVMNAQIVNIPDANFKSYLLGDAQNSYLAAKDSNGNIIAIDANDDGEIQVSEALTVWELNLDTADGLVNSLEGLEAFTNLRVLIFNAMEYNIDILDLASLTNLETLYIDSPSFSTVNLTGLVNLSTLNISSAAQIETLTMGYHPQLTSIILDTPGNLQALYLTGCPALEELDINHNNAITSVDLSACPNLTWLNLTMDALINLTTGNHPNLESFSIQAPYLSELDLSGCTNISNLYISISGWGTGNNVYINLKNGKTSYSGVSINLDAMHNYICIDEGEEESLDINTSSGEYQLSTYCSFTPGGDYNTIAGTVSFDGNNNGCDIADAVIPFGSISITDGATAGSSSGLNGNYNFYTQAGTFTLTPQFENDWFTAAPETVTFADNNNNTATQNFCVTANGTHNDAEVTIVPIITAQPGFDATYKILYKNKGNQTLSGTVNFTYSDVVLDYVSASPVETSATTGSLSWNYSNLLPFESRIVYVTLNVNSPMETPAVNIDDMLPFTVSITPTAGDETPVDNSFALDQTVVGSYDPNDITCLEGVTVNPDKIGDYLHYNINFENTGTAPATFVVVKDIIDAAKFDVSSLVVLNASHNLETRVIGNKAEFIFNNINLAANGGKGNVTFKIKSLETLAINSSVMQEADIFFDYNWPIVTNEAVTTYAVLNNPAFTKDASVEVYPNPATNVVSISAESSIQSLQLFDVQGRLLEAAIVNDISTTLDIASRAKGIYFIKIATEKGINVEKLVKE